MKKWNNIEDHEELLRKAVLINNSYQSLYFYEEEGFTDEGFADDEISVTEDRRRRIKEELEKAYETFRMKNVKETKTDYLYSDINIAKTSSKKCFTCNACDYVVSCEIDMVSHIRKYHVIERDYCEVVRDTEEELEHHVIESISWNSIECENCDFETNSYVEFDNHMEINHGTNKRPCTMVM